MRADIYDFYSLGLGDPNQFHLFTVSVQGMFDAIVENLPAEVEENRNIIRFSLIGRPNVESSLIARHFGGGPCHCQPNCWYDS